MYSHLSVVLFSAVVALAAVVVHFFRTHLGQHRVAKDDERMEQVLERILVVLHESRGPEERADILKWDFLIALARLSRILQSDVDREIYFARLSETESEARIITVSVELSYCHCLPPDPHAPRRIQSTDSRLRRRDAFSGASHPQVAWDSRWWLTPRDPTNSPFGLDLEQWMQSVRIVRRNEVELRQVAPGSDSLNERWCRAFQDTPMFANFNVWDPALHERLADHVVSIPWPGFRR